MRHLPRTPHLKGFENNMTRTTQQLFDLAGKTALVTGSSRGLGLQMARALGEAGARVMLCARGADALEVACADLQDAGIDARWVAADCAQEAGLKKLVSETLQRMGDIDILVNNAGTAWAAPAQDFPLAEWDKVMTLNVRGYFLLSQLVGKHSMIGRGGCIINVAHHNCKDAVINFTRALACEWRPYGINVNAICPAQPGHLGDDEDMKGATLLFASPAGKHITGQCLAVDGGVSTVVGA